MKAEQNSAGAQTRRWSNALLAPGGKCVVEGALARRALFDRDDGAALVGVDQRHVEPRTLLQKLHVALASGVPRACSLDFIRMPGTLPTPPPAKSGGRMKVSSAVWLAGSEESVLRRNDIVILNLRSGISMSARTAMSPFWLPVALICSVRQITEPIYC